jgi:hypothetical protein
MRIRPLIGEKLWFAPRRYGGWGWSPVSWEGWILVAAFVVAILVPIPMLNPQQHGTAFTAWTVGLVAVLIVCCVLKGTRPGGASARAKFDHERRRTLEAKR